MQTFIYGFCGALALVALLAVGVALGWFAHRKTMPKSPDPTVKQQKEWADQKEAFEAIQNYSSERAYGLLDKRNGFGGDGT